MSALLKNGYPKWFIHESASTHPAQCDAVIEEPKTTVCLPYVQRISEPLKGILQGFNIRTVMRTHRTLNQRLVHPKDAIPDMKKSGVICCIPCAECLATYVGETKRKLCKRMDEHKSTVRMADFNVSAIAEHGWNAGHSVDWNGVTILDQHKNLHPRLALEAFHIRKQPLPLDRDRGSTPSRLRPPAKKLFNFVIFSPLFYTSIFSISHPIFLFPV